MKTNYQNRKALIGIILTALFILALSGCSKDELLTPVETVEETKKSAMDLPHSDVSYTEVKKEFGLSKN